MDIGRNWTHSPWGFSGPILQFFYWVRSDVSLYKAPQAAAMENVELNFDGLREVAWDVESVEGTVPGGAASTHSHLT